MVSKGKLHDTGRLPGIVAVDGTCRLGLLLFLHEIEEVQVVTLDVLERRHGIGRLLLDAITSFAISHHATRVWLITTNENVGGIAFYTRCGFRLVEVRLDAITEARRLKPQIPEADKHGVAIRDELEFEKRLPKCGPETHEAVR